MYSWSATSDVADFATPKAPGQVIVGPVHIVATAAVWRFLFPKEAQTIERAAQGGDLYYSMECISRQVACVDTPGRPGCHGWGLPARR